MSPLARFPERTRVQAGDRAWATGMSRRKADAEEEEKV